MGYTVVPTNKFKRDVRHYKKKYKNIAEDVDKVVKELEKGNLLGTPIPNIEMSDDSNNIIKVRAANSDIPCGERGGYRIIYYAVKSDGTIYLLSVYSKREQENITNKEIQKIILDECI